MRSGPYFRRELNKSIDFDTVLTQIAAFASFSCSKNNILNAMPADNLPSIRHDLSLAREAMAFLQGGNSMSVGGITDISSLVTQASKGVTLLPSELLQISFFLAACQSARNAFQSETTPLLAEIAGTIDPCKDLSRAIDEAIDLSGNLKDDASPELKRINRRLVAARADLSAKAKNFIRHNTDRLMDTTTSMIGGRMCVLAKASDKYAFSGMVHGSSQSGQAFYVEPGALVEANNEIQTLNLEKEEEKKRICRELSRRVKNNARALDSSLESLTVLDTAMAKGGWALANDGCVPSLSESDRTLRIEHAVHPLLDRKTAVPNTYSLKSSQNCLMISGPNMGGKTVTLKTIGLFVTLAQSGFPVSAHSARLPFFHNLWFVIGDNQSIENSLSTFSSHISALAEASRSADAMTFALLDEMGNGTDPLEGASLAQAILEDLVDKKATIITSTHFSSMKAYGKSDPRILVSSMEFDPETLKPSYKYLPGISGSSYAFSIAAQYNLSNDILARARQLKADSESSVQKQLEHLEKLQQETQSEKDRFQAMIREAHAMQKKADEDKVKWEKKKNQLNSEYDSRLSEMLAKKEAEADAILKELRTSGAGKLHEQIAQKRKLTELEETRGPVKEKQYSDQVFVKGDYVHIDVMNAHGEVLDATKKKATVLVNGKKIRVSTDNLRLMKRPKPEPVSHKTHERSFAPFPLELNIVGMHIDEGIAALDHYLDQAVYHNVKNVRIIHGMGTGALRKAVWEDLKKQSIVSKYQSGGPGDGGLGATLVELK